MFLLTGTLAFAAGAGLARGAAIFESLPSGPGWFQELDTSIRAAGMGGATTAVGWGEPGVWGNPATLASMRGIAWLEGSTRLLPELDPPLRLKTRRFLLGGAGVGFSLMGEPVDGVGHTRFEYQTGGTDVFGNLVAGPKQVDEADGWGLALAPMQIADAIRARTSPDAPSLARRFDVSVGYQHKNTKLTLIPGVTAEADNLDWGLLARLGLMPGDAAGRSPRVEVSAGYAVLNSDDGSNFVFPGFGGVGPSTRIRRTGFAAHALLPFGNLGDGDARPWAWPSSLPSAVGLGVAYDRDERDVPGIQSSRILRHWGFEGTFMDILAARVGYVEDRANEMHHVTGGLGLHAPVGPWATVGYDWANHPSVPGMKNMNRHEWSLWMHPAAIWRSWRGEK